MKHFFAYIRVSTAKQGEQGVSLQEQRGAIERFAARQNLTIHSWFEERETAAKRGRPVFNKMLSLLKRRTADGVIIHKIDRSARNLKDWADLGELIDSGVEVLFANESLDLHTRGGRLSADIQAVVAADYIRNLREETKKGFYGRLKQGIYPLGAPVGYLNNGGGKPKTIDPILGPVIKSAFDLYATGRFTLETLLDALHGSGLRNRSGGRWSLNGISVALKNPFYIGIIRLRKTGETFSGIHEPLVAKRTFDRVQEVLAGHYTACTIRHEFLFRRMLRCAACDRAVTGERQKGYAYYRCHTGNCVCVREEAVEAAVLEALKPLTFSVAETACLATAVEQLKANWVARLSEQRSGLAMRLAAINQRLGRLTDAFIDGALDRELFDTRKASLLMERQEVQEAMTETATPGQEIGDRVEKFFELAGSAYLLYQTATPDEKRELLHTVSSNRSVSRENVAITLAEPFRTIATRHPFPSGALARGRVRTIRQLIEEIVKHVMHVETQMTT